MPARHQLIPSLVATAACVALGCPATAGASGCVSADAVLPAVRAATVARASVCVINAERRSHGLGTLAVNRRLSLAARRHSRDMVHRRYFAHFAPGGHGPAERIQRAGYLDGARRWLIGETLGWGWGQNASSHQIVEAWMHSPEHRRILLGQAYREIGVGVVPGGPFPRPEPEATFTAEFGLTD